MESNFKCQIGKFLQKSEVILKNYKRKKSSHSNSSIKNCAAIFDYLTTLIVNSPISP